MSQQIQNMNCTRSDISKEQGRTVLGGILRLFEIHGHPLTCNGGASTCIQEQEKEHVESKKVSREQRIRRHHHRCSIEEQVYDLVDKLRMNKVTNVDDLQYWSECKINEIQVISGYISLRSCNEFTKLREQQLNLIQKVLALAIRRTELMDKDEAANKSAIVSILYKESLELDKLAELDVKVDQLSMQHGVSGAPFLESGRLLGNVWGIKIRKYLSLIGKG